MPRLTPIAKSSTLIGPHVTALCWPQYLSSYAVTPLAQLDLLVQGRKRQAVRYCYSIKTGSDLNLYDEGAEWPNIEEATTEAIATVHEILADAVLRDVDVLRRWFENLAADQYCAA